MTLALILTAAVCGVVTLGVLVGRFIAAGSHLDPPTPGHTTYQKSQRRRP